MAYIQTLDEFVYHRNSVSNGTEYYKCAHFLKEKCKARLIIKSGQLNPIKIHSCKKSEKPKMYDDENVINEYLVNASKDL
ncbi:hypothetical protein HZS_4491 [Henneguya salminicola]|nr:hypothetical protein HZS_4491 [Henneguya salminicola]